MNKRKWKQKEGREGIKWKMQVKRWQNKGKYNKKGNEERVENQGEWKEWQVM